jgi:thioredoxin
MKKTIAALGIAVVGLVFIGISMMVYREQEVECKESVCALKERHDMVPAVTKTAHESATHEGAVIELTADMFDATIANTKPVIVDFYATWCPPCKAIKPIFVELAQEQKDWVFAAIDVEKAPAIMSRCGVKGMPTLVVFKKGIQWGAITGFMQKERLLAELQKIINADHQPIALSKADTAQ